MLSLQKSQLELSGFTAIPRKIPIGENCHSQKVYGIFPIWQFVQENCHMYLLPSMHTLVLSYLRSHRDDRLLDINV